MGWLRRITFNHPKNRRTFEEVALLASASPERLGEEGFLALNRAYWCIEGVFHSRLDGALREDKSRVRHRNAAFLLGLFRRLTVSLASHWIAEQPAARPASCLDFLDAMNGRNQAAAFALATARRPRLPRPS